MRVIAGSAKSRRLLGPKGNEIRPVLDQVKEAIFNILYNVEGLEVLDLFAGTGAMGIEALSRGAAHAVFVDISKEAIRLIGKNLRICELAAKATVLQMPSAKVIAVLSKQKKKFGLIFVDPPYEKRFIKKTLLKLAGSPLVHEKTIIISEHHPKEPIGTLGGLILTDERKYGQTLVSFLRKEPKTC